MDWPAAITTATQALGLAKTLVDVDRAYDQATFKMKIAELSAKVAEMQIALSEAQSEAAAKDDEIARLQKTFAFREEQTVKLRGMRYEKAPDGNPQGEPFCTRCEVVEGRFIPLARVRSKGTVTAICPQCKMDYGWNVTSFNYAEDRAAPPTLPSR